MDVTNPDTTKLILPIEDIVLEEDTLEDIYDNLKKDETEIKEEVEVNERINEKIAIKMSQK